MIGISYLFCSNQKQTLLKLVLLPTPFTPTKTMLNVFRLFLLSRTSLSKSVLVRGVRMRCRDSSKAACTCVWTDWKVEHFLPRREEVIFFVRSVAIVGATFLLMRWSRSFMVKGSRSVSVRVRDVRLLNQLEMDVAEGFASFATGWLVNSAASYKPSDVLFPSDWESTRWSRLPAGAGSSLATLLELL